MDIQMKDYAEYALSVKKREKEIYDLVQKRKYKEAEALAGELVEQVGFIDHPSIPMAGASPDGLVAEGLVEFKCPNTSTHLDTLLGWRLWHLGLDHHS